MIYTGLLNFFGLLFLCLGSIHIDMYFNENKKEYNLFRATLFLGLGVMFLLQGFVRYYFYCKELLP